MMFIFGLIVLAIMCWGLWSSTMMIEEEKERYRQGFTDYYGNRIGKGDDDG